MCPEIIFIRKAANKSSSVEFLFLEFIKSNLETLGCGGGQDFAKGNLISCLFPKKTHHTPNIPPLV